MAEEGTAVACSESRRLSPGRGFPDPAGHAAGNEERDGMKRAAGVLSVVVMVVLMAAIGHGEGSWSPGEGKGSGRERTSQTKGGTAVTPLIDQYEPQRTETASFALG